MMYTIINPFNIFGVGLKSVIFGLYFLSFERKYIFYFPLYKPPFYELINFVTYCRIFINSFKLVF